GAACAAEAREQARRGAVCSGGERGLRGCGRSGRELRVTSALTRSVTYVCSLRCAAKRSPENGSNVTAEAVGIAIAAPPSDGEANAELCRYLSKVLEVKKSEVTLEKGGKSREKVVKIVVSMTPDEVLEKLKKEASS
uniref:CO040 protein n=1 Tax=Amazona collaria TaxID=241587 RepID=A0A8B9IVL7_9PSIT